MTRVFVELPLTAYPKSEKDNLTKAERNELKRLVEILDAELNRRL